MRENLGHEASALDLKSDGLGIISWTTRGQLGIGSKIKATTGFQVHSLTKDELVSLFIETLKDRDKSFEFTMTTLRSAKDIYLKGGHVAPVRRDQIFRLFYDNRRIIKEPDNFDQSEIFNTLLDSEPLPSTDAGESLRYLGRLSRTSVYQKFLSTPKDTLYKNVRDVAIRNFLKGLLRPQPKFDLNSEDFNSYQEIVDFITDFAPSYKITKQSISNLKNRKTVVKVIPRNDETESFAFYIKKRYPHFNIDKFFDYQENIEM